MGIAPWNSVMHAIALSSQQSPNAPWQTSLASIFPSKSFMCWGFPSADRCASSRFHSTPSFFVSSAPSDASAAGKSLSSNIQCGKQTAQTSA